MLFFQDILTNPRISQFFFFYDVAPLELYCTDLNFSIGVKTIGPMFQVTPGPDQAEACLNIVEKLRRDKLAYKGGGECYSAL